MLNKSSILYILFTILISFSSNELMAQEELKLDIKKALVINPSDFGNRSVNQKNIFEYLLATDNLETPVEGMKLFAEDTGKAVWNKISIDEKGWYSDKSLRGAYAYLEVYSDEENTVILEGSAYSKAYINRIPRTGNVYQFKDHWQPWEPRFGFSYLPVKLNKGKNEFILRVNYGNFKVKFFEPKNYAQINSKDLTIPDLRVEEPVNHFGALIIINSSDKAISSLVLKTSGNDLENVSTDVPIIQPYSTRKVRFDFKGKASIEKSVRKINLTLYDKITDTIIDEDTVEINVQNINETYRRTFISNIDGSVQFYAVNPTTGNDEKTALFLSLHGAAVNAENQANSYAPKNWGTIVSPTNRRPYGFNWEDWGRLDAMEVFDIAMENYNIDPSRVYLTGHSMGGHGTWHIGGTFPDKFAAIGPSAGWISFWSYRFNDKYEENNPVVKLINRTGNPSNTFAITENYNQHGVYIIHGADDDNVRASQSHSIVEHLENSHKDFVYHEEKDAGHWWDKSEEQGADCVDWAPLFDYFARHARPERNRKLKIRFTTASPGVSEINNWVTIYRQEKFLEYSKVDLLLDPGIQRISGTTENISILAFDTDVLDKEKKLKVILDDQTLENIELPNDSEKIWFVKENNKWALSEKPNANDKSPIRYGNFKDVFRNNMVFVYGTDGTEKENELLFAKARYDAEYFWYQGNGSVELISDKEYDHDKYKNRNIIIFGNSENNSVWEKLLSDSPVQVDRESVMIGEKKYTGNDLSCLFIRPRKNDNKCSIGIVSATGLIGQRLNYTRPYMSPGFTYPDVTVFSSDILKEEGKGYKAAGFFGYDWTIETGEFVFE